MAKLLDKVTTRVANSKPTTAEDDPSKMEYLKAVVREVLRLHPPAPLLVLHESTAAAVVEGYEIPAKTVLFVNAWAIGRDPAAWGETAEEFWPERFLDGGSALAMDVRGNDYQLLPFGSGRQLCPSISFALPWHQLRAALASASRCRCWRSCSLASCATWTRRSPAGRVWTLDMSKAPGPRFWVPV
ncbi:hypothetical protein ACQ4PT_026092 [Festuca glaucescens]